MFFVILGGIVVFAGTVLIVYLLYEFSVAKDEIKEQKKKRREKDDLDKEIEKEYKTLEELINTQKRLRVLESLKKNREGVLKDLEETSKRMEKYHE